MIAGGHTIESIEPFFGLVCIGQAEHVIKNLISDAHDCHLVMTKKLGVGIVTNALKKGILN